MALTIFMALLGTPSEIIFGNSILIRQNQRPTMPKCKAPVLSCAMDNARAGVRGG